MAVDKYLLLNVKTPELHRKLQKLEEGCNETDIKEWFEQLGKPRGNSTRVALVTDGLKGRGWQFRWNKNMKGKPQLNYTIPARSGSNMCPSAVDCVALARLLEAIAGTCADEFQQVGIQN